MKMKKTALTKVAALMLLVMAMTLLPAGAGALAATDPAVALDATITNYYQTDQRYVLDDWEELAAVYAAGEDLNDYVLPATPASGAGAVFASLMRGDAAAAHTAATGLVSGQKINAPGNGNAYTLATNMLAVEAYNRSATGSTFIAYDKSDAVSTLLGYRNGDGFGYTWDGVDYDDVDSAGMALAALALYTDTDYSGLSTAKNTLTSWIKTTQEATIYHNANTTAAVLYGLHASGTNASSWTYQPIDQLLTFFDPSGGFHGYLGTVDAGATKQATLALAENVSGSSFWATLTLNPNPTSGKPGDSGGGPKPPPTPTGNEKVYLTVTGPNGTLYARQSSPWYSGVTPLALLKGSGLAVVSDTSGYVSEVEGIAEFAHGVGSGWLFKVNGDQSIKASANAYQLRADDEVVWFYTRDYTREQGSAAWSGANREPPLAPAEEAVAVVAAAVDDGGVIPAFADVPAAHWAHDDILYLTGLGLINGKTEELFVPEDLISRAEFTALLARMSADALAEGELPFVDVEPDDWYARVVAWGASAGVVTGIDAEHFAPEATISRQDMAVMLLRFVEHMEFTLPRLHAPAVFSDQAQIAAYARDAVGRLQTAGILNGRDDNAFAPNDGSTRAEAAAILARLLRAAEGLPAAPAAGLELMIEQTAALLLATVPEPHFGAVGGEWAALGLARSEVAVPDAWWKQYYDNLTAYADANDGVLHARKNTEYARAVMALTALGLDPADVGGHDLLTPLGDYEHTVSQGLNGAIFALIALDCGGYALPNGDGAALRERYLQYLLERQLADGGFCLSGDTAEADITAMALQALAAYRDDPAVKDAIAAALVRLSRLQRDDGSFTGWGKSAVESTAQALIALGELGIDDADPRFTKNGRSALDHLLSYYDADTGFAAVLTQEGNGLMSLEQLFNALVSCQRLQSGRLSLYDMSDGGRL